MLFRPGVRDEFRREAVTGLAKLEKKSELPLLLGAIQEHDADNAADASVSFDLARMITSRTDLASQRATLEKLATSAKQSLTRQLGYVALVSADGGVEKAWATAGENVKSLQDLVDAVPMIGDPTTAQHSIRSSRTYSTACQRLGRWSGEANDGTLCADRVARQPADTDARRSGNL
jgi:hypothetical protein